MKRTLVSVAGSVAALSLAFGPSANANPYDQYSGSTYAKVQEQTNGRAKIASRVGEYLATEDCIVTGSRRVSFLDSSGNGNNTILVDLNCNDPRSAGGDGNDHAGNSVMSPAGKRMADLKDRAAALSRNYEKSVAAGKSPACEQRYDSCVKVCQQSGACSAELLEYLGI